MLQEHRVNAPYIDLKKKKKLKKSVAICYVSSHLGSEQVAPTSLLPPVQQCAAATAYIFTPLCLFSYKSSSGHKKWRSLPMWYKCRRVSILTAEWFRKVTIFLDGHICGRATRSGKCIKPTVGCTTVHTFFSMNKDVRRARSPAKIYRHSNERIGNTPTHAIWIRDRFSNP